MNITRKSILNFISKERRKKMSEGSKKSEVVKKPIKEVSMQTVGGDDSTFIKIHCDGLTLDDHKSLLKYLKERGYTIEDTSPKGILAYRELPDIDAYQEEELLIKKGFTGEPK